MQGNEYNININSANKLIAVSVELTHTVLSVKEKLEIKEGFSTASQQLFFNGKELDNEKTLANYSIHKDVVVNLRLKQLQTAGEFNVIVKSLTGEQFELITSPKSTVESLKNQIANDHLPASAVLIFSGKKLEDSNTIESYGIHNKSILFLVSLPSPSEYRHGYSCRIAHTRPSKLDVEIPLEPEITVKFVGGTQKIEMDFFADFPRFQIHGECTKGNFYAFDDCWHEYMGEDEAKKAFWTDSKYRQRFMVLELREEFTLCGRKSVLDQLDEVRYNSLKANKSYYKGDIRSWQRYTHQLPLEGKGVIHNDRQELTFKFTKPLKPGTWYAIVLLHTSPNYSPFFYEDYIIPFRTIQ